MSRLKQAQALESAAPTARSDEPSSDRGFPAIPDTAPDGPAFPELILAKQAAAYSALLERLRARLTDVPVPRIVIASVSHLEPVDLLVAGLAQQVEQRGLRLACAKLETANRQRVLRPHGAGATDHPGVRPADERPGPMGLAGNLDTSPGAALTQSGIKEWVERAASGNDLVLLQAPPLLSSAEGALIARSCDGLLIVVQPMATTRQDLREAVAQARTAGCELLGLVITGSIDWLPRGLRRFFGRQSSSLGR
ncbi:MAG: CpsD/CapB family tyrosine-protein kinase [bacterium]|nr:CpsD/CapB family tyrosine-protein kinase [bacterium]